MPPKGKYAQIIEDEAAKAEAEAPDEDEPGEPEPEPVEDEDEAAEEEAAEPEAEAEPLSMEARAEAIETLVKMHFGSLEIILGDEWASAENCLLCGGLGVTFADSPVLDESLERCPTCRGHGYRDTPSLVPEHMRETCLDCSGNGWRIKTVAPPASENSVTGTANGPAVPSAMAPMPWFDPTVNAWRDPQGRVIVAGTP